MAHISRAISHASVGIFTSASVLISAIALFLVPHLPSFFLSKNHKDSRLRSHLTLVMKLRGFCSVQFKDITDLNNYHKSSSNYTWHKQELSIRITVRMGILLHCRSKLELGTRKKEAVFVPFPEDCTISSMSIVGPHFPSRIGVRINCNSKNNCSQRSRALTLLLLLDRTKTPTMDEWAGAET